MLNGTLRPTFRRNDAVSYKFEPQTAEEVLPDIVDRFLKRAVLTNQLAQEFSMNERSSKESTYKTARMIFGVLEYLFVTQTTTCTMKTG